MNVAKILGHRPIDGTIAVEHELESKDDMVTELAKLWSAGKGTKDWVYATDGSLRYYGIEFKSTTPVNEKVFREHINNLHGVLKNYNWIGNSPRTSVHYHLNVLGHTPTQVYTAAIAYWFLEDVFMHMCASSRKGNLFCLRLQDANGLGNLVIEDANGTINHGYQPFDQFRGDHYRYAAFNLNAVNKFGSVESRAMDGTLDPDRIELAGKYLINLVHRSKQFDNPEQLVDEIGSVGYVATANKILGYDIAAKMNFDVDFDSAYERVADIAYSVDWKEYDQAVSKLTGRKLNRKANLAENLEREYLDIGHRLRGADIPTVENVALDDEGDL